MEKITHNKKRRRLFHVPCFLPAPRLRRAGMFRENGYTILELMVVVSIVSALCFFVAFGLIKVKLQFALSHTAYQFEQNLRKTQEMSLLTNQYKDENGQLQPVAGFGGYIDLSQNNKEYTLYADHVPRNQMYNAINEDYLVSTVKLEPGIIIAQIQNIIGDQVSINFKPPNPITSIQPLPSQNRICVVFAIESYPDHMKRVSINTAGLIEVLDGQNCNDTIDSSSSESAPPTEQP